MKSQKHPTFGLLLLALIACSCGSAQKGYQSAIRRGNEEILRTNLSNIRQVIKEYANQKGAPPNELSDLVKAGYINEIPADPMTNKVDWTIVRYECLPQTKCRNAIKDIHSSSSAISSKGDR